MDPCGNSQAIGLPGEEFQHSGESFVGRILESVVPAQPRRCFLSRVATLADESPEFVEEAPIERFHAQNHIEILSCPEFEGFFLHHEQARRASNEYVIVLQVRKMFPETAEASYRFCCHDSRTSSSIWSSASLTRSSESSRSDRYRDRGS